MKESTKKLLVILQETVHHIQQMIVYFSHRYSVSCKPQIVTPKIFISIKVFSQKYMQYWTKVLGTCGEKML